MDNRVKKLLQNYLEVYQYGGMDGPDPEEIERAGEQFTMTDLGESVVGEFTMTIFYSKYDGDRSKYRTLFLDTNLTRMKFDTIVCQNLMFANNPGPGKILRYEKVTGNRREPVGNDVLPTPLDKFGVFVEDVPLEVAFGDINQSETEGDLIVAIQNFGATILAVAPNSYDVGGMNAMALSKKTRTSNPLIWTKAVAKEYGTVLRALKDKNSGN